MPESPRCQLGASHHTSPNFRRPYLLSSALVRVGMGVAMSAVLWVMTGWALGWLPW